MSIRKKITLLLTLLALVMAFQSADRVVQLLQSAKSFEALAQRIELATSEVETLDRATGQIADLTYHISVADIIADAQLHRANALKVVADAHRVVTVLGVDGTHASPLSPQFEELAGMVDVLTRRRSDVLEQSARIDRLNQNLRLAMGELRAEILPFQLGLLNALASQAETGRAEKDVRLLVALSKLISHMGDLLAAGSENRTEAVQDEVAGLVSSSVTILATSNHLENQHALVGSLARIRDVLDGLKSAGPKMRAAVQSQEEAEGEITAKLGEISALASGFVRAEEQEVRRVYFNAVDVAERELWSEIVINVGLGLGIVLAVWFVFARQISARLERLSRSVLRLAEGDLSPVEVPEGHDELSRMTAALTVFRQNAQELRRSNEELANFAYAASHDLRTPLRAIRDLVDWTLEDSGKDLHPDVAWNLNQIRVRADRLSLLLKDLLDYARAGRGDTRIACVNVAEMLDDVVSILDPGDTLELRFEGEHCIMVDAVPLRTILLNLVANAVRHRDRPSVLVTVAVDVTLDGWMISVRDDGPGIPLRYQKKVFELFQTLQSRDVVEGSGLGLAMVEKLAGHIGGAIELRSNPDEVRGTAFILHIPNRDIPAVEISSSDWVAA